MLTLLPAAPDDAVAILAIQKRAFENEARLCDEWDIPPLTESLESVLATIKAAMVLTARDGPRILGSIRGVTSGKVCSVERLSIEPDLHGRGIGSALLTALERAHPQAEVFELLTNAGMEGNIRFYQRHGYRIAETRKLSEKITLACMSKPAAIGVARPLGTADVPAARR